MQSALLAADAALVQLATRIPRRIARTLKEHCARQDLKLQAFVRQALEEKLARSRPEPARRRA